MEPTKECIQCGAVAVYKEGVKNGRPWRGYFCTDKQCKGKPQWVSDQLSRPASNKVPQSTINPSLEVLTQILVVLKQIRDQGDVQITGSNNPFPQ